MSAPKRPPRRERLEAESRRRVEEEDARRRAQEDAHRVAEQRSRDDEARRTREREEHERHTGERERPQAIIPPPAAAPRERPSAAVAVAPVADDKQHTATAAGAARHRGCQLALQEKAPRQGAAGAGVRRRTSWIRDADRAGGARGRHR